MNERTIWWGAMAVVALVHVAALALDVAVYVLPVLMVGALAFLFWRGEEGAFPFRKRHVVQYQMNYFGFVGLLAIVFNTTPRVLPSGAEAIQPYLWALPLIALYVLGLYLRKTA